MSHGEEGMNAMLDRLQSREREGRRSVVYSLVPRAVPSVVLSALRGFFGGERDVKVIVDRRARERRRRAERRTGGDLPEGREERRRIRSEDGRRMGEHRAELAPIATPAELPPDVREYADRVRFVERLPAPPQAVEDLDTARLVTRLQAGEADAFDEIYERYVARVYGYMRVALRDEHEAEDAAHEVFVTVLQALPNYELRGIPFRMWLFRIVRNYTLNYSRRHNRTEVMAADEIAQRVEGDRASGGIEALGIADDSDLLQLIRTLPLPQRQVIVLRYVMDFDVGEIASILGRTPNAVSQIHRRAFTTLRLRLLATGRHPDADCQRLAMSRCSPASAVTVARRLALTY